MEQVQNIRGFGDFSEETKNIILNNIKQNVISFSIDDLNMILNDQSYQVSLFKEILNLFSKSSVELEYPSDNFQENLEKTTKLKKNEIEKLQIKIFISNFDGFTQDNFDYTCIDSVVIKDTVTSIPSYAFKECESLKNVIIPRSVTQIGKGSFFSCSSLESIQIPSSVVSIGECAFANCSSLKEIKIPNSITTIKDWTFLLCSNLSKIEIPNSVTSIGMCAFSECKSLLMMKISPSVTSIGNCAFFNCSYLCYLEIPSSVVSIGPNAFGGCALAGLVEIPSRFDLNEVGISSNVNVIRN